MSDQPATPQHPTASALIVDTRWEITGRDATGSFVVSMRGTLLFRVDQAKGLIYAYDRKGRCEVAIPVRELLPANFVVQ